MVVAPTTNCGLSDDRADVLTFPAEFPTENAVRLTGVDSMGQITGVNFGAGTIELAAVGVGFRLLDDGTVLTDMSGAPQLRGPEVSSAIGPTGGAAALVVAADGSFRGRSCDLRRRLLDNASMTLDPTQVEGGRLLDVAAAVRNDVGSSGPGCATPCPARRLLCPGLFVPGGGGP